jgi:N-methylhydantoinase B
MRKSWSLQYYQTEALAHFLDYLLCEIHDGTAALVLTDGRALHVHTVHPADTATLPAAATQCFQYFQLKDGEVAIGNDPYAGGTRLSDITLVMGIAFETPGESSDVLLAVRLRFPPKISLEGKLEEEGLRIPPMPIMAKDKLNTDVLKAMADAPHAPVGLVERIESAVNEMSRVRQSLKQCGQDPGNELRKANFKRYFQDCHDIAVQLLHKIPLGEALVTARLESGELTKLRLEATEERVTFDFTGTEASKNVQLTDLATLGACFSVVQTMLGQKLPANAGVFSCVQLLAPARTWVNAKAPAATARGVSDGVAFVSSLGVKAFAKLNKALAVGASAYGSGHVQFTFENNSFISDVTPGGTGAGSDHPGIDGWNLWLHCDHPKSIEEIEIKYPLQIKSVVIRPASGGRGKFPGGSGLVKTYSVTKNARVTWALEQATHKPEGADGGKPASTAEITLQRAGSDEKADLAPKGSADLQAGDVLRIYSAGGGAFGAPEPEATS